MRARKNPPPFTLENLIGELKPGRGYSVEALALMFGVSADEVRRTVLGAIMLGKLKESRARRGMRIVYWVPKVEPQNIAQPRALPSFGDSTLTGYTAWLWRLHDLCTAAREQVCS